MLNRLERRDASGTTRRVESWPLTIDSGRGELIEAAPHVELTDSPGVQAGEISRHATPPGRYPIRGWLFAARTGAGEGELSRADAVARALAMTYGSGIGSLGENLVPVARLIREIEPVAFHDERAARAAIARLLGVGLGARARPMD
jgi:hypothetical protein